MIERAKAFAKRHWPALRLRTILLAVLFFSAAMPGIGAVFLRVYENTLVRQTEAEMVAQSAALAATAQALWPGGDIAASIPPRDDMSYWTSPSYDRIDLSRDPVLPERPAPAGVDAAAIDAEALAVNETLGLIIDQTERTTLASILLLDRHGRVVGQGQAGADLGALPEVAAMLKGEAGTVLRRNGDYRPNYSFEWLSRASALRIHHARPIEVNGQVVGGLLLSRSPRALFRGIYEDRGKIAFAVAVIFGMLIILSGLISRGVTRPIEALSDASRDVAGGRGTIPDTPQTAAVEIRQLYEDFRAMAQTISVRSRYLRDFAAALSHEFKTPLAGIAGAVEILEDHHAEMSEEERRRFLANISADTARLSQLVRRLLDLARADMAEPDAGAAANLTEVIAGLADALRQDGFGIIADLPAALPRIAAPAASLETVFRALIENARQAGASQIAIRARRSGRMVAVSLSDNGPGIPEADLQRIFEPFFTSRRADGGSGLGLPIARSLIAASRGEITAVKAEAGARFELKLPAA